MRNIGKIVEKGNKKDGKWIELHTSSKKYRPSVFNCNGDIITEVEIVVLRTYLIVVAASIENSDGMWVAWEKFTEWPTLNRMCRHGLVEDASNLQGSTYRITTFGRYILSLVDGEVHLTIEIPK